MLIGISRALLGLDAGGAPRRPLAVAAALAGAAGQTALAAGDLALAGGATAVGGAVRAGRVVRQAATPGTPHWRSGRRFHLRLRVPPGSSAAVAGQTRDAVRALVRTVRERPEVITAYWDGGLSRLVVQVAEDAATDRVLRRVADLAAARGFGVLPASGARDAEAAGEGTHPGDPRDVRVAAGALALDAAGLAAALVGRGLRVRRPPALAEAAVSLLREDPRARRLLRSRLRGPAAEVATAAAGALVHGLRQSPGDLLLDAGMRSAQLAEAIARAAAFDRLHDELCVPERPALVDPPPVRRDAPDDPAASYAATAGTAGLSGAAAALLFRRGTEDAAGAVLAGSPRAVRYGLGSYLAGLGCALAREGVLLRDVERLRQLTAVDTVVLHAGALHGTRRTVLEVHATDPEWDDARLWQAAERALEGGAAAGGVPEVELRAGSVPAGRIGEADVRCGGRTVGTVRFGHELLPEVEAVFDAARRSGLRVVVAGECTLGDRAVLADEVTDPDRPLSEVVRTLQESGRVVLTVARLLPDASSVAGGETGRCSHRDEPAHGLLRGDLAVALTDQGAAVPWGADVLCQGGLPGVWRVLLAAGTAREVVRHGRTYAQSGSALAGLLLLTGRRRRRRPGIGRLRVTVPAIPQPTPGDVATLAAAVSGLRAAFRVAAEEPPTPQPRVPWHALSAEQVADRLARVPRPRPGMLRAAAERTAELGSRTAELPGVRVLAGGARLGAAVRSELHDPLTPVLAVGALASSVLGSTVDAALVAGAMGMNALVAGAQRLRADRALGELTRAQRQKARIVRRVRSAEREVLVDAPELTLGQVIVLQSGDVVPADARLVEAVDLEVDESALTGESMPVAKQLEATPGAAVGDRTCMVFEGTTVVAGEARAAVVATGRQTVVGRAVALAARSAPDTGVQARLHELTRNVLPLTLVGGGIVAALALLRGRPMREALSGGVTVAVAAVPEGLPLVATVAQAAATRRLGRRGVLVRAARTLEALGRVDTVCFDKTGTLTQNRLRVVRVVPSGAEVPELPSTERPDGDLQDPGSPDERGAAVLRAAARACPLNGHGDEHGERVSQDEQGGQEEQREQAGQNDAPGGDGGRNGNGKHAHATDEAVLAAAGPGPDWTQVAGQPFEASRGYAAAIGRTGRRGLELNVKGAPEVILPHCTAAPAADGRRRKDAAPAVDPEQAAATAERLAAGGWRVLAVARRKVSRAEAERAAGLPPEELGDLLGELELLGFVALADAPRPSAEPVVEGLRAAGVSPVMLTGDHPQTARAIAVAMGWPEDTRVVTGDELVAMDSEGRAALLRDAGVLARVAPEQKLQVVEALREAGRVVAMVGDGANDAAAIRAADVGIGLAARGSAAARNAADLVLTDADDLSALVDAIAEGRQLWRSVADAVSILTGGNAGEVAFSVLGTLLSGRSPLSTRQLLLVNLLTDMFPAMAVAVTPGQDDDEGLAAPSEALRTPLEAQIVARGAVTALGATTAWLFGGVTPGTARRTSTMALCALVGAQLAQTLIGRRPSPLVLATSLGSAAALMAIVQTPGVSQFFGCTPLGPLAWAGVAAGVGAAAAALVIGQPIARRARPRPTP